MPRTPTKKSRQPETSPDGAVPSAPQEDSPAPETKVFIKPLNIFRTSLYLKGTHPLIMHAWSQKAITMIEDKQMKKVRGARPAKDPREEFEGARYKIDESTDGVPAVSLKSCAVEAGVALDIHKTLLRKSFFVCPDGEELVPILCPGGPVMRRDQVRIGMGTADLRYRPEYKLWGLVVPVEFNLDLISLDQLANLFDHAGYSVGLGEWRPQRNGPFGRFRVVTEDELGDLRR
jgi:hypothetical protein